MAKSRLPIIHLDGSVSVPEERKTETVEQICERLKELGPFAFKSGNVVGEILATHKQEVTGLVANIDALERAIEVVCDKETVKKIIAKKKELRNG